MTLYATARRLLDDLADAYTADGLTLPARRYVVPGTAPAEDDEQVTVAVVGITSGTPGNPSSGGDTGCGGPRYATYRVAITRCTPTVDDDGGAPSADDLDASAEQVLGDVEALDRHLQQIARTIVGHGPALSITNAVPAGPSGGLAGASCDVDLPLYV